MPGIIKWGSPLMRMRNKALLFLLGSSFLFIFLTSVVLVDVVSNYFARSEQRGLQMRAKVLEAMIEADLSRLSLMAMQYGNWDDLRKFVNTQTGDHEPEFDVQGFNSQEFLVSNFETPRYVLQEQRHGVFIADHNGRLLFADRISADGKSFAPAPSELSHLFSTALRQPIERSVFGVVRLENGTLVALGMAPILNSGGTAQRRGNILFYREYGAAEIAGFASKVGFRFYFSKARPEASVASGAAAPADLGLRVSGSARSRQWQDEGVLDRERDLSPADATLEAVVKVSGDTALAQDPSIVGQNAVLASEDFGFQETVTAWMFPQFTGERSFVMNAWLLSSILTTLAFAAMVYAVVGYWLVRPAEDLVGQIQAMIDRPQMGPVARISDPQSSDEFGDLTKAFNGLLAEVERQESSLRQQERLALLGTMQAEFAHEVANPLAALVSYVRRVHDHMEDPQRLDENKRHLEKIDRIATFLSKLLNTFRTASRGSTQKSRWQNHDLAEVLEMASVIGNVKAKKFGVDLQIPLPSVPLIVHGDPSQLLQIINNLVSNGIDAAAAHTAQRDRWVRVECAPRDTVVVVTVTDSGPGVDEEMKAKLFTRFSTTKGTSAGTGLGLALSLDIIRELGGVLRMAESTPHTAFEVEIPLVRVSLLKSS